jgi:Golgi phosphoprotein 3 (GPP34)
VPPVPLLRTGRDADPRIANDLFLIAHRDWDGRPLLPGRVMGLAMAGAMLCELALEGCVGIRHDALVARPSPALTDQLGQSVLAQLLSQPDPLPVKDWLAYLASDMAAGVGQRLVDAGVVEAQKRWRGVRFMPLDSTAAFFTAGKLAVLLDNGSAFSLAQSALVGLVEAAGLLQQLPCADAVEARSRVAAVAQSLQWPLDGLVAETAAAVDKAIITGRT